MFDALRMAVRRYRTWNLEYELSFHLSRAEAVDRLVARRHGELRRPSALRTVARARRSVGDL